MDVIPWRAERRQMYDRVLDVPRLVSFHDLIDEPAPHPRLKQMRRRLNDTYGGELGEPFTTAGLCLYRDGDDSVAWHGDTIGRSSTEDTMVAIVCLGATRVFALRPRGGGKSLRLQHRHGDLLVMGGSCQRTWEHADTEDHEAGGPADQHPVPAARRALRPQALDRGDARAEQVAGALGVDRGHRLVRHHERVGGDDHHERAEAGDVVVKLAGARLSVDRRLHDPVSALGRGRRRSCGASTTSTRPRTPGPANPTFWQFAGGLVRPARSPMSPPRSR